MTILAQIKQALSEMGFKAQPEINSLRAELDQATTKLAAAETDLQAQLAAKDTTVAERDATIKELTAKLETAQGEVNAKGTEIKTLTEKADKAEKKADETLAALGVDPKSIPAAPAAAGSPATGNSQADKLWAQYNALTDPGARTQFWRKNSAAMKAIRQ
jgi:small-conductance mechanosensitive channel